MSTPTSDSHARPSGRRGNAAVLGIGLVTLLAVAALVIDVGFLYAAQTQIQVGVDAGALGGVGYLDYTDAGVATARAKAVEFAGMHDIMGEPLVVPDDAITTGYLDPNGVFVPSNVADEISALHVDHTKVDIPVWFANIAFGRSVMSARAESIAARSPSRSAGRVPCFLPLAVPVCILDEDPATIQSLELKLSSAGEDNVGWADLMGNPTPGAINDALLGQCDRGNAQIGDDVFLNNGTITSSLMQLREVLNGGTSAETVPWNTELWGPLPTQMDGSTVTAGQYGGNVLEGPILIFDQNSGACLSDTQFNQTKPIAGFTWAVIYDVDSTGGDKNIRVRLDLTNEYDPGNAGGGTGGNILAPGIGVLVH